MQQRYQRAEKLLPWHLETKLKHQSIEPHWLDETRFWFKRYSRRFDVTRYHEFVVVDCQQLTQSLLFDHDHLAAVLSEHLQRPFDPKRLPIEAINSESNDLIRITLCNNSTHLHIISLCIKNSYYRWIGDHILTITEDHSIPVMSPDKSQAVIERDHNLVLQQCTTGAEIPLTTDGERYYGYGTYADFTRVGFNEGRPLPPTVLWSQDGRYLAVKRVDERKVKHMPLMQVVPTDGGVRPVNHPYKVALLGDADLPLASVCIIDLKLQTVIACDRPPMAFSGGAYFSRQAIHWGSDNVLYFVEWTRGRQSVCLVAFDPITCASRVLVEEKATHHGYLHPGPIPFEPAIFHILPQINEFIWYSHRSGWGQLYLYDLITGELKNAITAGESVVTALHSVDPDKGCVYFSACGHEEGRNPYYEHLYRVNLNGSERTLLTPEDSHHSVIPPGYMMQNFQGLSHGVSPQSQTFVDTYSRVDQPPISVLRSCVDGAILMTLSQCDPTALSDTPYSPPLSFTVKAADKVTDLWGVIYRPSDFDHTQYYPVVLALYGGPQQCVVPRQFAQFNKYTGKVARTLAELGLIVITLDPRGTPMRSKAFQDEIFGNYQNGGGIADQIAAIQQLGKQYPWMDINRVGITGHSNGGFASARAMLSHPEFFKVAVSIAGNHDQSLYFAGWGEVFQGLPENDNYKEQACKHLAQNLRGKLLLVHGDGDANVHIAQTMQLVDQLITHNKDFDLLVLPNRQHDCIQEPYVIRRIWDYFVEHLLNETPPKNYVIALPFNDY